MNYKSTRGKAPELTISQAIIKGIAEDGGLYVPEVFPKLSCDWEAKTKSITALKAHTRTSSRRMKSFP